MTVIRTARNTAEASESCITADPDADDALEIAAQARRQIRDATPAIVAAIILKAIDGSYLHAKFLFELASTFPLATGHREMKPRLDPVTEMLKRLGLYDAADARERALSPTTEGPVGAEYETAAR